MRKPAIIVAIASVVALFIVGIAVATSSGNGSGSETGSGVDGNGNGGGLAAGACPAADVPGITDEERDLCFQADGGNGGPVDENPADSPVTDDEPSPVPSGQDPGTNPALPDGRRAEPAPIDGLDVRVAESFPPQYFLSVLAGLPSGCAEQYKHEVSRDGDVITVSVLNSFPEGDPICTMIYGMYELDIALGSDFEPGQTYTVVVNDQETTFTAQ